MNYFLLIATFNAFFFAILLLQKKPKALHDYIFVYWLVYLGLFTGSYVFYSRNLFTQFPLLSTILFKRLDLRILNNFSFSERINLDWLRKLVYIFGLVWTALT